MFLELVPECERRNSSFQDVVLSEIHGTNVVMPMLSLPEVAQWRARTSLMHTHE